MAEDTLNHLQIAKDTLGGSMDRVPVSDYYLKAIAHALVDVAISLRQANAHAEGMALDNRLRGNRA